MIPLFKKVYLFPCPWGYDYMDVNLQLGKCSEIERQNQQTVVSGKPTGVCCSKRQWVTCYIYRQNSQRLRKFSNNPLLDKKQVVNWVNKRNEMWQKSCVNWIPLIRSPKERNKNWWAKWPTSKFENGVNVPCV